MTLLLISIFFAVTAVFIAVRNAAVFETRIWLLHNDRKSYDKPPGYYSMMKNPTHWCRWTPQAWQAWARKQ